MQQGTAAAGSPRTPSVHARCQRLSGGSPAHVPQSTTNLPKTHKSRQQVPQSTERDVFRRCSGRLSSVIQALQAHHEPPDCSTMYASPILPIAKDSPHRKSPSPRALPRPKHTSPSSKSPSPRNKIVFWLALDAYLDRTSPTGSPKAPSVSVR